MIVGARSEAHARVTACEQGKDEAWAHDSHVACERITLGDGDTLTIYATRGRS